ncbi:MOSC domain-containing protein [Pricia sp.]|uniref:MOSC domain-containing protein n=1 Tax=Pricia sp. TaxID=2268138 RepID=UPI003593BBC6
MATIVTDIYEYPLKSSKGNRLKRAEIGLSGLKNDRKVAVIDNGNRIITGRDFPELVRISSEIKNGRLILKSPDEVSIPVILYSDYADKTATLFGKKVAGAVLTGDSSQWISDVLKGNFRLIYFAAGSGPLVGNRLRKKEPCTTYVDSAPVHLINLKTLAYLNSKLPYKVGPENFRPNIVVDGDEPFEEDYWTEISINGCRLKVQERTKRCIFITINPKTALKNPNIEPLSTLARIRRSNNQAITFGIDLAPINQGFIYVGDNVIIRSAVEGE